jgi:hypothetical protein
MRKYLMTGVAAIAFCAAFTSCSKSEELYDAGQITKNEAAQIEENYNRAFIATFGQPAANQDWGFGSGAGTRTWNVEGNLWHDPAYYNLEYDAKVTTAEKNLVFNYVNNPTNVRTVDQISFTKYWVAQIWNGNKDKNAENEKAPVSISYPNQNGATEEIIGGAQMDKLEIKEKQSADSWIHCNNFNAADNKDWKEDGEGGRTLMWESGTYSFRYTNSHDSYLSEKYIIVPGSYIDASLADFYYVCFDYERGYTDAEKANEKTYISFIAKDNNGYEQAEQTVTFDGYYTSANMPSDEQILTAFGNPNYTSISSKSIKGYLYGDKHCDGDGNYTDWIVRISPARVVTTTTYVDRIIAEDLNAQAPDSERTDDWTVGSDWDFNDVVFDVRYEGTTKAYVKIVGAGGVYPLYVAGEEVHKRLGQSGPDSNGLYKIQNSGTSEEFEVTGINSSNHGKDIRVTVVRKSSTGEDIIKELKAEVGKPAAKIRVNPTFEPCAERQDIRDKYPYFGDWVTKNIHAGDWQDHKSN